MNILIVGSGGREHAITKKLFHDNPKNKLFCISPYQNPGISKYTTMYFMFPLNDLKNIIDFVEQYKVSLVVIGPEKYLEMGLANCLYEINVACIGPTKEFAQIETSKSFLRNLMIKYNMEYLCPKFKTFTSSDSLHDTHSFITTLNDQFVVKYNGLKGGKGVKVSDIDFETPLEGLKYCQTLDSYVVEEKLVGNEFSIMSFCDGINLKHMPPIQDFKRLNDDNQGEQTGGMGCISHPVFLNNDDINTCQKINYDIIAAISRENKCNGYKGIIYGSFIKTKNGIKVIEYNARFGDPECILALRLLNTSLVDIFYAIINGTLNELDVEFSDERLICKYLVPYGYPSNPLQHQLLDLETVDNDNIILASVDVDQQTRFTSCLSSRTLAVIGKNTDDIHSQLEKIPGKFYYRKDIGKKITYNDTGVNIDEGNIAVQKIKQYVQNTYNSNVINTYGSFGGLYRFNNSTLVASTDGVGTKSKFILQHYPTQIGLNMLGHDIVNHCVNDILVEGAIPEFFLDYFAASHIQSDDVVSFVHGVSNACKQNKCVLLGGETAEMPDIYTKDSVEIVGTIIGSKKYSYNGVQQGDIVFAFPSVSLHTNGFSLVRKILNDKNIPHSLLDEMCAPHKSYLEDVTNLINNNIEINGLCHITGGGLIENPKRVLPKNCEIMYHKWNIPRIFYYMEQEGNLCRDDMLKTFNMGIGMMVFMNNNQIHKLENVKHNMFMIGHVV